MKGRLRILLVEDSEIDEKLMLYVLREAGWDVACERVETAEEMRSALARGGFDAVLSDWSLPRFSGPDALKLFASLALDLPFVIVSGTVGEEAAVEAMRAGARDYVLKDRLARLAPALERELAEAEARRARRASDEALRRAEEQLRQAQKLEAIGGLAAGIAHDFNNLLTVVLGTCDLLLSDLPKEDPTRTDIGEIHRAGQRGAQLTQQLLAFARRQVLQPRNVDLDEVVAELAMMLRRLLGENIQVDISATEGLGKTFVDPGQVEQVILNLAVNARDAMPGGGTLSIETANVQFEAGAHPSLQAGPYVMLAVSDTGTGMDADTKLRIFEPFFTTKLEGKGTGLGLSTVFGIVEQSQGAVWVHSELGKGTTFKLYFPQSQQTAEAAPPRPSRIPARRGSACVLVVEDDPGVRKVVRAILQRHGYVVLEAEGGRAAIELSDGHPGGIDLLLTDVIMPHMSGRELASKLHASRPSLRVLYMSGYTDNSIVHHGVLDPDIDFLQKPITPEALLAKVRDVLEMPA